MRSDIETEYRWAFANKASNPSGAGNPTTTIPRQGKDKVVTMYVENNNGSVLHESRHGGDIARGTLTGSTYGVQDEVSAYKAQYSFNGSLPLYLPVNSKFTNINNINLINASFVNNIGYIPKSGSPIGIGVVPLYPPRNPINGSLEISQEQWDNN